ncbi:serine/threonine-protein kinase [Nonomuraea soli]|uniref:non-specific serine/threonine protein kinase n=1 Tax=Nonomuraea soli TaxID=1032476 RepID=A0A7W0CNU3_9ACTN|nr:serine/threonine-protein kinase [Nonomuraea soli]MBA2894586.1 serine/threonine protein kinase [Nonomuraea soli]
MRRNGGPEMSADRMLSGQDSQGHASSQGRLVGNRYRLMSPVGRGGMGMVWHAHDVLLDRDVAVKELLLPYGLDQAGKQVAHRRMLREARSAARLTHPGIVTVHDVVEEDGRPWIVMELVRAWSLEQAVRQSGPLPVIQAAEIGIRVLDALRHAHAAGILHRDIKPGNVLLTTDRVVLTDFGIAAIEGDVTITQTGLLMGSPAYIPPERLSGQPIGQSADLWSFGATLYAAVEGRPPFEGPDAIAVLGAVLTQEPIRPQRAGALMPVIEGLLRKNPAERLPAAQVAEMLERVLRSHGSPSSRAGRDAIPTAADSTPIGLLPPLDQPSGPLPSRIIETPSGPVRVPYDPNAVQGFDPLASPSSEQRTDRLTGYDAFRSASGPVTGASGPVPYEALRSPSGPVPQEGPGSPSGPVPYEGLRSPSGPVPYEALRSPSGPVPYEALRSPSGPVPYEALGSPSGPQRGPAAEPGRPDPYEELRSLSGPQPAAPKPQPILPLTTSSSTTGGRTTGGTPWPLASSDDLAAHSRDLTRDAESAVTHTGGQQRIGSRRRAEEPPPSGNGWMRDGRPTPRLMLAGAAALAAATLAVVIIATGGDSGGQNTASPSASASETVTEQQGPLTTDVPDGYKEHVQAGFAAAVPAAWKVSTSGGETVFTGPKDSGMKITVRSGPAENDGGLAKLTAEERAGGVDDYIQVQLQEIDFRGWKAADWEYTYRLSNGVPMHALARYVSVNDSKGFKIVFTMSDLHWDDQAELRQVFLDSFGPRS